MPVEPLSLSDFVLLALAAVAAGAVNALAGGGTLITFPTLTFVGVPAVSASVTNTVALVPGYLGATMAQAKDLAGQRRRLWLLAPTGVVGGIVGGYLLLQTDERLFRALVPYLILLASGLLAFQDRLRGWVQARSRGAGSTEGGVREAWVVAPVFVASIYGGYFGAGLSVIVLAVLALVIDDTFTRLNALKQAIAFSVNVAAALFFLFSGRVVWPAALAMAVGALAGGVLGGWFAGRVRPEMLRRVVVVIGVSVAVIYLAL
jgi:hypothetical protein